MSIVRMDIDILKQLSNNEAATYFSLISVMDNQGKCNLKLDDIAKVAGFSIATLIDHFAKFKDKGIIQIDKVTR